MRRYGRAMKTGCIAVLTLALGLAGCAAGPAPMDHFYRIEVGAASVRLSQPRLAGVIEVDRPRADTLTDQLPLLYRQGGGAEVKRHSFHRWMTAPSSMIQHDLIAFLRSVSDQQIVPPEVRVRADVIITGRILRLERVLEGGNSGVVIELDLGVSERGGKLILLRSYREERAAEGSGVPGAVTAFGVALTAIFERFVHDLNGLGA